MRLRETILLLSFLVIISASFAQVRTTRTSSSSGGINAIFQMVIDNIVSAFKTNPIYPILVFIIGAFPIGWFAHQMMFGY